MRVFLTGISGFLAKHLAEKLLAHGYEVDSIRGESVKGVNQVDSQAYLTKSYDYIINLAATTTISTEFKWELFYNNVVFAHSILSTPFRTIYASSTSAYELNNPYAYTKAYNEWLGERHGNALGLRLFNIYGPNNNKGIVKKVIECCLKNEPLTIAGGDQVRDFIYVDDVTELIIKNLDNKDKTIDIGTGTGTSINDVICRICELMGVMIEVKQTTPSTTEQLISVAKPDESFRYTSLEEGLKRTIQSFKK